MSLNHRMAVSDLSYERGLDLPQEPVEGWRVVEAFFALAIVAIIGTRFVLTRQITLGYLPALFLMPLWFPMIRRIRVARVGFAIALVAVGGGILLAVVNGSTHRHSTMEALSSIIELLGVLASAAFILWAMKRVSVPAVVCAYALGVVISAVRSGPLFQENPWRYGFAAPVMIFALGLVAFRGVRWESLVLVLLAVLNAFAGARSATGIIIMATIVLWFWTVRARRQVFSGRRRVVSTVIGLGLLGVAIYYLAQAAALEGFLGQFAQTRTELQLQQSGGGGLVVAARPEIAATVALMLANPWGYGVGVLPSLHDIQIARDGMYAIGYDPLNGYVDHYMFGSGWALHSNIGNLWAVFGLPGFAFALYIAWMALAVLARGASRRAPNALLTALSLFAVWGVVFEPFLSSLPLLTIFISLAWLRLGEEPESLPKRALGNESSLSVGSASMVLPRNDSNAERNDPQRR